MYEHIRDEIARWQLTDLFPLLRSAEFRELMRVNYPDHEATCERNTPYPYVQAPYVAGWLQRERNGERGYLLQYIYRAVRQMLFRFAARQGYGSIDWRLILTHPDYAQGEPTQLLRMRLAKYAKGTPAPSQRYPDGSSLRFPHRTYACRYHGERRIEFRGELARTDIKESGLPCRCATCGEKAEDCNCEWYQGDWVRPRPMVESGISALSFYSEPVQMIGKEGRAVGVELELRTVGRYALDTLERYCSENLITRKSDGSNGVSIELATSPMREDVYVDVLCGLHSRLMQTHAYAGTGCGLHVHVDATSFDGSDVDRLISLWRTYGSDVWDAMPTARHDNQYCYATSNRTQPTRVELYGTCFELDGWEDYEVPYSPRYVDMNLENLKSGRKTIEFRLFPAYSTDDGNDQSDHHVDLPLITEAQLLTCVDLSRAFLDAAQRKTTSQAIEDKIEDLTDLFNL